MAKPRTSPQTSRARGAPRHAALGPGLHAGTIELRSGASYRVRTATGARLMAVLGDEVEPALAEECLRAGRTVVLCDTDRGPTILGGLQTSAPITRDADGRVAIRGSEIRLQAEQGVLIEAGPATLRLHESGAVRIEGERMVIDMPALLRVLSASVELP